MRLSIALMGEQADLHRSDTPRHQGLLARAQMADGGIAAQQVLHPVGEGQLKDDTRIGPAERSQNPWQHLGAGDLARRQPYTAHRLRGLTGGAAFRSLAEMRKRAAKAPGKADNIYPPPLPEKPHKPKPRPEPENIEGQGSLL